MSLRFTKMHGLGNDFMVIDAINQKVDLTAEQICRLSDRHTGVGFDQLLLIEAPQSTDCDFFYRIFNADGSEVAQCGNGARCLARFASEKKLTNKQKMCIETKTSKLQLELLSNGLVRADMGIPNFEPEKIPFDAPQRAEAYAIAIHKQSVEISALSLGNPHAVIRVKEIATAPVISGGAALSKHPRFPEGANVSFMQCDSKEKIYLRVYERGVGETLACGSGACAAVIAGHLRGWLAETVEVVLPGGSLTITWQGEGQSVLMTGPAVSVFDGELQGGI